MITLLIIGYIITMLIFFIVIRIYDNEDIDHHVFMSIIWPITIFTTLVYCLFICTDKLAQKIKLYINQWKQKT